MPTPDEGAGATLTFGTSGTTLDLLTVEGAGRSRASLDKTHHNTTGGYKEFQPATNKDPGVINATFLHDPNVKPPWTAAAETITLTYPPKTGDNNGATEASSGFIENWDGPSCEIDGMMIGSITIKRSGALTFTTSST